MEHIVLATSGSIVEPQSGPPCLLIGQAFVLLIGPLLTLSSSMQTPPLISHLLDALLTRPTLSLTTLYGVPMFPLLSNIGLLAPRFLWLCSLGLVLPRKFFVLKP